MYLKLIYSAPDSQGLELLNETNVCFIKTEDMASARAAARGSQQCEMQVGEHAGLQSSTTRSAVLLVAVVQL